ncbi:MAG TPA: right-handed parallel beta-helix repeat-containing protein [Polyangiaceae bacterium]|nr:right-handed parallel beta-helix repeat-containing protein [Polyangiaceae bacterium]
MASGRIVGGASVCAAVLVACGSSGAGGNASPGGPDSGAGAGGANGGGSGGSAGASPGNAGQGGDAPGNGGASNGAGGSSLVDSGTPGSCEAFGHFGAPGTTFTLPSGEGIYYPDVQKSFPDVDWTNLDRLYVPAGEYEEFNLGNLPTRTADHPLVITNQGGGVKVGPNLGANYLWSMGGGSHWILSGRYDEDSKTGDASVPGHRCGAYANTRGKYGFLSDDGFDLTAPYLHMGISVSDATDFEIEYVEVTRSGFAGIRLLNSRKDGDPAFDMANVRIHDDYIHDTAAEGTYFGWTGAPPANLFPGLRIYNNRILRTGNEALQIQDLGDGAEVYDNVIAFAALHFRDNGLGQYQDNNAQVQTRSGTISLHDNVFIGGAGTILSFWSQPETGDGARHVTISDSYFSDVRSLMAYLGGESDSASDFHFVSNVFRGMDFSYDSLDPAATNPGVVFQISPDLKSPIEFSKNHWEGPNALVAALMGGNGTKGTITGTANVNETVAAIQFEDSGYPDGVSPQALEIWGTTATLSPGSPAITYAVGALVMDDAELYRCTATNSGQRPKDHPESWEHLPPPADDVRVKAGTPYERLGVH